MEVNFSENTVWEHPAGLRNKEPEGIEHSYTNAALILFSKNSCNSCNSWIKFLNRADNS